MFNLLPKTRFSLVAKMSFTALFTALTILLLKLPAMFPGLGGIAFLRVSIGGPALIIFSSIFLGPLYGMFVGASSDVIGYLIFDIKAFPYSPYITILYAVLGFATYYVVALFRHLKSRKLTYGIMGFVGLLSIALMTWFLVANDSFHYSSYDSSKIQTINNVMRILVPCLMFISYSIMFGFVLLFEKRSNKTAVIGYPQLALSLLVIETLIMVLFGSFMKVQLFGYAIYLPLLLGQVLLMFINVPVNVLLISIFQTITNRFYKNEEEIQND